jgi:nucleoside-diphosphate-sugar epimerase
MEIPLKAGFLCYYGFMDKINRINVITGATGFVGRNLVDSLLEKGETVYVVIRSKELNFHERAESIFPCYKVKYSQRFRVIEGEITKTNLGIKEEIVNEIKKSEVNFWHLAANLSFRETDKERILKDNVKGVENVVEFVNKLPSNSKLFYTSTAFVCGSKNKRCFEDEINKGQTPRNIYEKTKIIAEKIIRDKCKLNFLIFRPSIIIGDAYEGKAAGCTFGYYRFTYVFYIFKKWTIEKLQGGGSWKKILELVGAEYDSKNDKLKFRHLILPFPKNSQVDLIPIDFVIDSMIKISKECQDKKTFHIVNIHPPSFIFLFRELLDDLGMEGIKLIPVNPTFFNGIIKACYFILVPLRKYFESAIKYKPYITMRYEFSTDNMRALGLIPADISKEHIKRINRYAIASIFPKIKS